MFIRQKTSFAVAVAATLFLSSSTAAIAADSPQKDDPPKPESQPRRGGGDFGQGFGPMGGQLERFQQELDLSPEQMEKLQGLGQELQEQFMDGIQRFQEEGFPSGEEIQKRMEEFRTRVEGRLGEILTPDQQEKLRGMMGNFGDQFGGPGGPGIPGGEDLRSRVRDLGRDALLEQIKAALMLSEEEEQVLIPLIKKVIAAQGETRKIETTGRAELTRFLRSGAEQDAIAARVGDFRKQRADAAKTLAAARAELRELLTIDQEAKLIAFGILD